MTKENKYKNKKTLVYAGQRISSSGKKSAAFYPLQGREVCLESASLFTSRSISSWAIIGMAYEVPCDETETSYTFGNRKPLGQGSEVFDDAEQLLSEWRLKQRMASDAAKEKKAAAESRDIGQLKLADVKQQLRTLPYQKRDALLRSILCFLM